MFKPGLTRNQTRSLYVVSLRLEMESRKLGLGGNSAVYTSRFGQTWKFCSCYPLDFFSNFKFLMRRKKIKNLICSFAESVRLSTCNIGIFFSFCRSTFSSPPVVNLWTPPAAIQLMPKFIYPVEWFVSEKRELIVKSEESKLLRSLTDFVCTHTCRISTGGARAATKLDMCISDSHRHHTAQSRTEASSWEAQREHNQKVEFFTEIQFVESNSFASAESKITPSYYFYCSSHYRHIPSLQW